MNEEQVSDFLNTYAEVLSRADAGAMARLWNVPALVVGGGQVIAVGSPAETEQFFMQSFAQYHASGVQTAIPAEPRVALLSDSVASVAVHWIHENADGLEVGAEDAFYILARDSGSSDIRVVFYTPIEH
ncbi:MAG TPA: hypothetical protein VLA05_10950 [Coriobacteriia bacterium]|nr:hypothetical protein [Coriobacteriia bacterium]